MTASLVLEVIHRVSNELEYLIYVDINKHIAPVHTSGDRERDTRLIPSEGEIMPDILGRMT